ncbi:MAG: hypothetical protein AAF486_07520 [Pseudomonadota bacterium]
MLFLAACGAGEDAGRPEDREPAAGPAPEETELSLPAVWSTRPLAGAIQDLSLVGGPAPPIAAAYAPRGLQIFNLEGEVASETADLGVAQLARGAPIVFGDTPLLLFPGIDSEGVLTGYLFGPGLSAPEAVALPIEAAEPIVALCSQALAGQQSMGLDLVYWASGASAASRGTLEVGGDALSYTTAEPAPLPQGATGCVLDGEDLIFTRAGAQAVLLDRKDAAQFVVLQEGRTFTLGRPGKRALEIEIRPGLSVDVPSPIKAIDGLGQPRDGGYPGGVIVVAGPTPRGERIVFIDTSALPIGAD